jgi:hypothetical protein
MNSCSEMLEIPLKMEGRNQRLVLHIWIKALGV